MVLCEKIKDPDLSIVIPTWNHKTVLGQCLESIYESEPRISYDVVVVDNGSADQTCEFLAERFPMVRLVRNERNLGFSRATNQGIRFSKGRYVLCLNNDTLVHKGTLDCLVHFMDDHPTAGAAAPKLTNTDGSLHVSAAKDYTSLKYALLGGAELPFPFNRFIRPMILSLADHDKLQEVAWVPGTCMIVRRDILCDVGLLDENIFMYMEDMEWCYRIRMKGWKIFFVSDTGVMHLKHHSSQNHLKEVFKHEYLSKKYFIQKHRSEKEAILFTIVNLVGSLIKLPIHSTRLLFGDERRRKEVQYKIGSHWQIIKCILCVHDRKEKHRDHENLEPEQTRRR